jgi:hypothetical protein
MKQYLKVQNDRKKYHINPFKNTVHRSSLFAPSMHNADTWITFVNHFLIKRNYKSVALKLTAIGNTGNLLDSQTIEISEPKVYAFNLSSVFNKFKAFNYLIEFYSDKNLFVPFPAVIVSHVGKGFCNIVHAYNRILNDVFENDNINEESVAESSIDVLNNKKFDTFFNLASGMSEVKGDLDIFYEKDKKKIKKKIKVSIPRLSFKTFYLSKILPSSAEGGTVKINQPKPDLFFGRMLAGRLNKKTKAFSSNHSFYDCSKTKEYFNSKESYRTYPYFKEFNNQIIFYPIMSKSNLNIVIEFKNKNKKIKSNIFKFKTNAKRPLNINVSEIINKFKLNNINAFTVRAVSSKGKIPTRVNHQLVYGGDKKTQALDCSINVSLTNDTIFTPSYKKSFIWGAAIKNDDYNSKIGFCFKKNNGEKEIVEIDFYGESGKIKTKKFSLQPSESKIFGLEKFVKKSKESQYLWYIAKSNRSDLNAYSVHKNLTTDNSSGEHNF